MRKFPKIEIGEMYGRFVVLQIAAKDGRNPQQYYCQCLCGQLRKVRGTALTSGMSKSCGCLHKEIVAESCGNNFRTHGLSKTSLAYVWGNMKKRCYYENCADYKNYGARGIIVCDEWKNDFNTFSTWSLANGYQPKLELDRKDNDGNYTPENCHFVTKKQNRRNKRNVKLTMEKAHEIRQLAGTKPNYLLGKDYGISGSTVGKIIANNAWV